MGKQLQIMSRFLGSRQKRPIGHQSRAREIIGQPNLGDGARLVSVEPRQVQCRFNQWVLRQQRQLQKHLKALGLRRRPRREGQTPQVCIIMPDRHRICAQHAHPHLRQRRFRTCRQTARPGTARKPLRCAVHRINIIVAIMKEVAHFFPWARLNPRILPPQGLV